MFSQSDQVPKIRINYNLSNLILNDVYQIWWNDKIKLVNKEYHNKFHLQDDNYYYYGYATLKYKNTIHFRMNRRDIGNHSRDIKPPFVLYSSKHYFVNNFVKEILCDELPKYYMYSSGYEHPYGFKQKSI